MIAVCRSGVCCHHFGRTCGLYLSEDGDNTITQNRISMNKEFFNLVNGFYERYLQLDI